MAHQGKGGAEKSETLADQSTAGTMLKVLTHPALRVPGFKCIASIFSNFFLLQNKAAIFPGRVPVTSVDHPLDKKIPFVPRWVDAYLDFVPFWIRILGFLLKRYRRRALKPIINFLNSMNRLYGFAAEAYAKNLSTTCRPFYISHPRFFLIHLADPHLMCIPSLHVMVMILSYTRFREILRSFGDEEALAPRIAEAKAGAALITEAILYVKQHSVNCVAAAMYAMSRFDPALFPPEEAEAFASRLFAAPPPAPYGERPWVGAEDGAAIRGHIVSLYQAFMADIRPGERWEAPLLRFLSALPRKEK